MIILIRRGGDVIYPRGHTKLRIGDRLTLMGTLEAVRGFMQWCE
jgi:Trk K+ transport system NAD-binding subunit